MGFPICVFFFGSGEQTTVTTRMCRALQSNAILCLVTRNVHKLLLTLFGFLAQKKEQIVK